MTHGTRQQYKAGCSCVPCKAAEAIYRARLRQQHAHGKRPLGSLIDAATARKLVQGMRVEGFTFTEIAKRLGLRCHRFRLYTDKVTVGKYLQLRRLYQQHVADPGDPRHL